METFISSGRRGLLKRFHFNARFEAIVPVVWLSFSLLISVFTPIGCGPDEPMHIARAAQVASGIFFPQDVTNSSLDTRLVRPLNQNDRVYGGTEDADLYELSVNGNLLFRQGEAKPEHPFVFPYWEDQQFRIDESGESDQVVEWAFPNTAINSPLCYVPHALGYALGTLLKLGSVGTGILMRVFGSAAFSSIIAVALYIVPFGKAFIAVLLFCPLTLLVNSFVTADSLTLASAVLFVSTILTIFINRNFDNKSIVALVISSLGIALGKMTYLPLGLLLLALPVACKEFRTKRCAIIISSICSAVLLLFLLWYSIIREVNTGIIWSADINPDVQLHHVISSPLSFITAFLKLFVNMDLFALASDFQLYYPVWLTFLAYVLSALIEGRNAAHYKHLLQKGGVVLCFLSIAAWVLILFLIAMALYLQFCSVGAAEITGVQSRYCLPILLLPLFSMLIAVNLMGSEGPSNNSRTWDTSDYKGSSAVIMVPCVIMAAITIAGMYFRIYS